MNMEQFDEKILPREIWTRILMRECDVGDVVQFAQVCRHFEKAAGDQVVVCLLCMDLMRLSRYFCSGSDLPSKKPSNP